MPKPYYLTTTLPYVNADPHIGFALELVQADIIARYQELLGEEVFFNTGTDEHGLKIYRNAIAAGKDPQEYVDEYAAKFRRLPEALGVTTNRRYPIHFIRTTDPKHTQAAQKFWRRCYDSGDIELKDYELKYCVGCELEKSDSELVNGCCPLHPNLKIELIKEKNYFFKFSNYQGRLLDFYKNNPAFVVPDFRFNEIKVFIERGLGDFSISRLKEKMPWGVPVPGDDTQVMFVWFDALVNYISTLGWPEDEKNFEKFWGTMEKPNGIQMAGKDQIRQQAAMWQAMLMSAGLPNSKQIVIHGFITSGGQKMSKSLGNVIDPFALVEEYGTDVVRYFLARHINSFEDSDFTLERFKEAYNANLANGLGNLVARVMVLAETYQVQTVIFKQQRSQPYQGAFERYEINRVIDTIWEDIQRTDQRIAREKPFEIVKSDLSEGKLLIQVYVQELAAIADALTPFMPTTSEKILKAIRENRKPENLFPRKD
ncbi:methionine--tRNA ligase [Candidatus Kaiserbacteria bacterium RIFCSPHIGHO2_02_FULL_50_9]|uniref:Methionine--tRNA ligase n=1 Tax=Candidatus Kaiserbacteria bacterium RIFCSPLOWO2_01_FULL_51_21 TaxID=1798508 RepID=A0A1F6ED95_9BACT|nr:MAG: methionine--tRNA ligase [Candidatus Kaiserbacteria bacterium RIFCSPHIGHO2_01_FULL_51_33]OGG63166.1 MAG: methionine--tRNA ligase [Candidatus Kaiserbacteria bacterium RIFCSPHIGHO2_02_FULL_50_9]OGG71601.1 MAG: methionine--tRNA ligase [Candidatus Kaiserbacteria bacterium RIFCSPLOWO2_01_FULL_51_21]